MTKAPTWVQSTIISKDEEFVPPSSTSPFSKCPFQLATPIILTFEEPRRIYLKNGAYGPEISMQVTGVEESWFRALMMRVAKKMSKIEATFKLPIYKTKTGKGYLNMKAGQVVVDGVKIDNFNDFKAAMFAGHYNNGADEFYKPLKSATLGTSFWYKYIEGNVPELNVSLYLNRVEK